MRSQVGGGTNQAALLASVTGLVHGSWRNVDHEHGSGGERFFLPEGVCEMPAMTMSGRQAIADGYAARRAAGDRVSRHLVSNLQVSEQEDSRIVARYALVLYAGHGFLPVPLELPQAVCDVEDTLVGYEDDLLIAHRRLEAVFVAEGNDSVMLRRRGS
ncbi:nuclear transport factor 2 family protein [Pseudarthrobacter sp. HLT3-5]|uniref:nuclear transport factor 2 family protein n=1 Tax=Pseudarthrobacter cellobiosi TaxID=2953654 RepID=UPI00208F66AC|nr:nuclear transport factor 2 family protein [Pseudarthrobacter sp. HLT3-5]MCO4273811.1 nuclear transport factor 2 family protein [Pseudarthrobacter sp. HLT3-5]